jgi:ribonuclease HII
MQTKSKQTTPRKTIKKTSKLPSLLKFDAGILAELHEHCHLIGLDEVGRGSLISSVVGGAVCLPRVLNRDQKQMLTWLDDSKKLTAPIRAELAESIQSFCLTGIGIAEKDEVDELNVHHASLLALYRALQQLCSKANLCPNTSDTYLIMDGKAVIPDFQPNRQRAIIKGDGCSAAIAAASVIAKHYRDTHIKALALEYPGYGWEKNMGYPAPAHLKGIQELGITPLHRKNFKQVHAQLQLTLIP